MSHSRWLPLFGLITYSSYCLSGILLVFILSTRAYAFHISDAEVTENKGIYTMKFSAVIAAHPDYIRYVLDDSAHIYRLSPSIIESEVLPAASAGDRLVRTRLLNCTTLFCKEIERVDLVRMLPSGDFEAEIIPSLSEFKSGRATWQIQPMDDHSYVIYEATLEPDFFIPPMLGTQMVKQILHDEFANTFARLEKIARVNARKDHDAGLLLTDAASRSMQPPCRLNRRASLK